MSEDLESHPFFRQILDLRLVVLKYEDSELQAEALEVMPLERLYKEADLAEASDTNNKWSYSDHLIRALLHWFHDDFFTFVRSPPCPACSCRDTQMLGMAAPTPQEKSLGAHNVELYRCRACNSVQRFPRINDVRALVTDPRYRRGRCGEWANCFTFLCRALGVPARYVWCREDHVWTEIYSSRQHRWIHIDSCEDAFDNPRIYADGWHKKISYCLGFSCNGAADITRRYVRHDSEADKSVSAPRDAAPEYVVQAAVLAICEMLRSGLPQAERLELEAQDEQEQKELQLSATETSV